MDEAAQASSSSLSANDLEQTTSEVEAFLQGVEDNPTTTPQTANQEIAEAFLRWYAVAEEDDSEADAQRQSDHIEQLSAENEFPWGKARSRFGEHLTKRPKYAYKKWATYGDGVIKATLDEDATVAIIGDWGTGGEDAKHLFREVMKHRPKVVLHLGDIYNVGSERECQENFLDPIKEVYEDLYAKDGVEPAPVLTIPGNHEYFRPSYGYPYYNLIERLNKELGQCKGATWDPADWTQDHSFFCLRTGSTSDSWQFLGADTGYASGAYGETTAPRIRYSESDWHRHQLDNFPGHTVFMTHHQFVSADSSLNRHGAGNLKHFNHRLLSEIKQNLDKIDLWLWGHDHYFFAYKRNLQISETPQTHKDNTNLPHLKLGQLLGGSAREVTGRRIKWKESLRGDHEPILPGNSTNKEQYGPKDLTNHTYAIINLNTTPKDTEVSYYQTHAWWGPVDGDSSRPQPNPLLEEKILE